MDISSIQQYIVENLGEYWGPVTFLMLCGGSAIVSTFLSAPSEDSNIIYKSIYKVINVLGGNVFNAKNADEVYRKIEGSKEESTEEKSEDSTAETK